MPRPAAARIVGLKEFQAELERAGAGWAAELKAENKAAATAVAERGKEELADTNHPVLEHVAGLNAVRAKNSARVASVIISAVAKRNAMSIGAVLGSKKYRQFPAYREAAWRAGLPTGGYGPYEAIREDIDEIRDGYGDRLERLYARAFPD